jgi:hypothetical protein
MGISTVLLVGALVAFGVWVAIAYRRARDHVAKLFDNLGLDAIRADLDLLLESRKAGAYLVFEDMTSKGSERWMGAERFMQFARIDVPGGATLSCDFPRAPWSEVYLDPLRALLESKRLPFAELPPRPDDGTPGRIVVDGLTPASATDLVDAVFRQVFGCPEIRVRVWGQGVAGKRVVSHESER